MVSDFGVHYNDNNRNKVKPRKMIVFIQYAFAKESLDPLTRRGPSIEVRAFGLVVFIVAIFKHCPIKVPIHALSPE